MHLVEIQQLSFSYSQSEALRNVTLYADFGEALCLVGPNGCGKTTLLDHLIGAHPTPKNKLFYQGKAFESFRTRDLAKHIGYVPQFRQGTFPYRVLDFVLMGRTPYTGAFSSPGKQDRQIALEALEQIGIAHFQDRILTQLSGGERQMVILARTLAQKTPLLLLDEPTAHLDFAHELLILETIVRLVKEQNLAVIMATHFPNHAFYLESHGVPTRVAMMREGELIAVGSPESVLTKANIETVFGVQSEILSIQDGIPLSQKTIVPMRTVKNLHERSRYEVY